MSDTEQPADTCRAITHPPGGLWSQTYHCKRKAVRDGFCTQHHPDAKKARDQARDARWAEERKNSLPERLYRAMRYIRWLEVEVKRLDNNSGLLESYPGEKP